VARAGRHIHLIAVAGTGMAALAGLLTDAGHHVTGADVAFYPPLGPALARWGIETRAGFDPAHLEPRPDLVVVGNMCRPHNPEARAAIDRGMTVTTMVGALADIIALLSNGAFGGIHQRLLEALETR
jgi:UDP-N-acetylmuramate: L-alanyl-gamma-D-glutamyl-meso-diaminopimelate ligase